MSNTNESFVTITENNSMMETKASFTESGDNNEVNGFFEEYERMMESFVDEIDSVCEQVERREDDPGRDDADDQDPDEPPDGVPGTDEPPKNT